MLQLRYLARRDALTSIKGLTRVCCLIGVRAFLAATVAVLLYHALGLQTVFALFNDPGFTVRSRHAFNRMRTDFLPVCGW